MLWPTSRQALAALTALHEWTLGISHLSVEGRQQLRDQLGEWDYRAKSWHHKSQRKDRLDPRRLGLFTVEASLSSPAQCFSAISWKDQKGTLLGTQIPLQLVTTIPSVRPLSAVTNEATPPWVTTLIGFLQGSPCMAKLWHEESAPSEPVPGPTGIPRRGFEYRKTQLVDGRFKYDGIIRLEDGDTLTHAVSVTVPNRRTNDPFVAAQTLVMRRRRRQAVNEGSPKTGSSSRSAVPQAPACVTMSGGRCNYRTASEPLCCHVACVEARPHVCTLSTSTPNTPGTAIVDGLEPSEDLTWRKDGIKIIPGDTFRLTPSADFWWRASKQVPCGTAFSVTLNINDENVKVLIDSANDLNIVHESVVTPTALSVAQPCLSNTKGIGGETTFEKVVHVGIQPPDKSYILWVLAMMSTKPISRDNKVLLDWTTFTTLAEIVDLHDGLNPAIF